LFDFGGTLEADGVNWGPRFHAAYVEGGGALEYATFAPIYKESDRALGRLSGIERLGFRATVEAQADLLRDLLPAAERFDARRVAARFHADAVAVVNRNRPMLQRLARRYRLGVVSNFTGNLRPCLEELELLALFAVTSDSAVLGSAKPDERIFRDTLAALGAAPEGAWMVGDNFEADIRPAQGLGLRTCWLAPPQRAAPVGCVPSARIARLPELERILG